MSGAVRAKKSDLKGQVPASARAPQYSPRPRTRDAMIAAQCAKPQLGTGPRSIAMISRTQKCVRMAIFREKYDVIKSKLAKAPVLLGPPCTNTE